MLQVDDAAQQAGGIEVPVVGRGGGVEACQVGGLGHASVGEGGEPLRLDVLAGGHDRRDEALLGEAAQATMHATVIGDIEYDGQVAGAEEGQAGQPQKSGRIVGPESGRGGHGASSFVWPERRLCRSLLDAAYRVLGSRRRQYSTA